MYKHFIIIAAILAFFGITTHAQTLTGKWITPDKTIIQFYIEGQTVTGKQISTEIDSDKKNNNKIIAKSLRATIPQIFEGTVIDPKNGKAYRGTFTLNKEGTELELKVKWGFINFKEIWKRTN